MLILFIFFCKFSSKLKLKCQRQNQKQLSLHCIPYPRLAFFVLSIWCVVERDSPPKCFKSALKFSFSYNFSVGTFIKASILTFTSRKSKTCLRGTLRIMDIANESNMCKILVYRLKTKYLFGSFTVVNKFTVSAHRADSDLTSASVYFEGHFNTVRIPDNCFSILS